MTETPDQIAARYGAVLADGVAVTVLPPGASSRPYPVWDAQKNALMVPDWKEWREAERRASIRSGIARAKAARVGDQAKMDRLREMHAAGMRVAAMAAALEISESYCRSLLSRFGLKMERLPHGPKTETLARIETIRQLAAAGRTEMEIGAAVGLTSRGNRRARIREAVADFDFTPPKGQRRRGQTVSWEAKRAARDKAISDLLRQGATEDEFAAALGIENRRHLRREVARVAPDHVFPAVERVPDMAARDATIRGMKAWMSGPEIAAALGLTRGQVSASLVRSRAAGIEVPGTPRPVARGQRKVHVARNARIMDLHNSGATVEAIMAETGLPRPVIARAVRKGGSSIRNARCTVPALRLSQLPDLVAQGLSGVEIADRWGCPISTVYGLASKARVSLNGVRKAHNTGTVTPRVAARRERVAEMVRRGMTDIEMLAVLKIHHSTLSDDINKLGLSNTRPKGGVRRKGEPVQRWVEDQAGSDSVEGRAA